MSSEIREYPTSRVMRCKIGTVCATKVRVDLRRNKIVVGEKVRVRELLPEDSEWQAVLVDKINADGFFFAAK